MKRRGTTALLALGLALVLVSGAFAAMQKAEMITGNQWTQWTRDYKLVYVRGLTNWADFVNEAQPRQLKAKSREFALSSVFVDQLRHQSLGQIVAAVNKYYRDNPGKLNITVIEAILRSCTNVCPQ
jgi:hypothetical protein